MSEVKKFGEPSSPKSKLFEVVGKGSGRRYNPNSKRFRRGINGVRKRVGRVGRILDEMKNAQQTQQKNEENSDSDSES